MSKRYLRLSEVLIEKFERERNEAREEDRSIERRCRVSDISNIK